MQTESNVIACMAWNNNGDVYWSVALMKTEKQRMVGLLSRSDMVTRVAAQATSLK